jgi:hypothetical protein
MRFRWNAAGCNWFIRFLSAGLVCLAGISVLQAQTEKKTEPNVQQPFDKSKLETRYNKDFKKVIEDLTKGSASAKDNADAVDVLAQWHTYRVTWPEIQSTVGAIGGGRSVMADLDLFLQDAAKNKQATAPLLEMFSTKVAEHMKVVLQNQKPIARVNGARVLARLAEAGQEEVADALVDTVKDPQQLDGVKYYALKGIKELFAQANQPNPTVFQSKTGKEREARCLAVLGETITRKVNISEDLPRDEKEGMRVVCREAVRALALNHRPAVTDDKGAVVDSPALTLLRVVRADGLVPEPRIDSQVEAAVGVARMSAKAFEGYQPDYAAYHLAWFVADFAQATKSDSIKRPWKVDAARLTDALEAMKAETAKLKEGKYIAEVLDRALRVLKAIETTGDPDQSLAEWLANKKPANLSVYKNVPESIIHLGGEAVPVKPTDPAKPAEPTKPAEPEKK